MNLIWIFMSCKPKIKNRWSRKNWSWQGHPSFLFTLIVAIVPILYIPPFVNRETNCRGHVAIAGFLLSSSNLNWLYCGSCPVYNTARNCCSWELVSVVPQGIFRGCDLVCRSYKQACVNISRKKNQWRNHFSSLVTWEPNVPLKVPLPQHSLTRKHREYLLDSQIRSEGENQHLM